MTQLTVKQRKWLKSIHVIAAGVWITTGLVMFLIHFMGNDLSTGEQLHLLNRIIYFIDMKLLVPSAVVCLLTGWMYSQFTKWGYPALRNLSKAGIGWIGFAIRSLLTQDLQS